jgi:hypothetical protein
MTKTYTGLGLSCMYPENWSVTEDTDDGRVLSFTLESPSAAFMTVTEYPWTVTPQEAIDGACEVMRAEYDEVEFQETVSDLRIDGQPLDACLAGEVQFFYLDLMVISRLVAFVLDQRTFMVQIQAEDRDFETLDMVFKAILISMLRSVQNE